jgi:ABC-type multidrug transport system ATPase subunit
MHMLLAKERAATQDSGDNMRSADSVIPVAHVVAAGVGLRHGRHWPLRSASFRVETMASRGTAVGIAARPRSAASALVSLLAGLIRPTYGELRVLGHDMSTPGGRIAARCQVGLASPPGSSGIMIGPGHPVLGRPERMLRIRGLIDHAARRAGRARQDGCDHLLMTAAILDRLALTPWAEVPVRSAPEVIARRARLAAAAACEPRLLILDGLLDDLSPAEAAAVADGIRELSADTAVVLTGRSSRFLRMACDAVLSLTDGIVVRADPAFV